MLNFPTTPTLNQYYSYGVRTWKWNGSAWDIVVGAIDASTLSGYDYNYFLNAANITGTYTGIVSGSVTTGQVSNLKEAVEDIVDGMLLFGSGVAGTYNDAGSTYTISGKYASTTQHGVAQFSSSDFTVTGGIVTVNDGGISIPSTQVNDFTEAVQDVVGAITFLRSAGGVTGVYNDTANTLTLSGIDATTTTKGVASFSSSDFSVTAGAVSIVDANISITASQVSDFTEATQDVIGGAGFLLYGNGLSGTYSDAGNTLTISGVLATNVVKGVSSFSSAQFSVTGGHVSIPSNSLEVSVITQATGPFILGSAADGIPDYTNRLLPSVIGNMLTGVPLLSDTGRVWTTPIRFSLGSHVSGAWNNTGFYYAKTFCPISSSGSNILINLPAPAMVSGIMQIFKKISADSNTVTISGNPHIDGDLQPFVLYKQWDSVTLFAADSWYVTAYHFE